MQGLYSHRNLSVLRRGVIFITDETIITPIAIPPVSIKVIKAVEVADSVAPCKRYNTNWNIPPPGTMGIRAATRKIDAGAFRSLATISAYTAMLVLAKNIAI